MRNILSRLFTTKTQEYQFALEHRRQNDYIFYEDSEEGWFIDAHQSLEEFNESHSCVLWMHSRNYGSKVVCRAALVYFEDKKELLIGDIESNPEGQGFGSIMMRCIIDVAHKLEASSITGNISAVDMDHFDKLQHFYEKHGFTFILNKSGKEGSIQLKLSS